MPGQSVDLKAMTPLLIAMALVAALVLIADIVILCRWLIYQVRLQEAQKVLTASIYAPPISAESTFDLSDGTASEGQTRAPVVPPLTLPSQDLPRPPFARTWSLVHPFLGFQAMIFATLACVLLLMLPVIAWDLYATMHGRTAGGFDSSMNIITVLSLFVQNALTIGVVIFFLKRYGTSLREIGLGRITAKQLILGVGLGLAVLTMATFVETSMTNLLAHLLSPAAMKSLQKMSEGASVEGLFAKMPSPWLRLLLALGGIVAAPLGEEVFFRGFVYNALKRHLNVRAAIVLSGLIFAFVHFNPLSLLVIFPMGMLLAYAYERTGSLWVTTTMHAVNNGLAFVMLWYAGRG